MSTSHFRIALFLLIATICGCQRSPNSFGITNARMQFLAACIRDSRSLSIKDPSSTDWIAELEQSYKDPSIKKQILECVNDGWGEPFRLELGAKNARFTLTSSGVNRKFEHGLNDDIRIEIGINGDIFRTD